MPGPNPELGVTQILASIEEGHPQAAEKLLPLVYEELRRLAASHLAQEQPGQWAYARAWLYREMQAASRTDEIS